MEIRFTERADVGAKNTWERMLSEPFLREIVQGIKPEIFDRWAQQDYLFARESIRFLGVLMAKAPYPIQIALLDAAPGYKEELKLFEDYARSRGFPLDVKMSITCRSYLSFLMKTAYNDDFPSAFTALYAEEKAYLDSWRFVKNNLKESPYEKFIDHWSNTGFQDYVKWLAKELDSIADQLSEEQKAHMESTYKSIGEYECLFWEMPYRIE